MQNDIDIFRGIKSEIQKNPENFKPAGQWLDGLFQNKSGFIKPMSEAFTKAACEYPLDSRKIMLIARLLTDKYLSESKLGITKYEQYAFQHEVREPNKLAQLITEQEMAKDAVFAKPDAMEIIRDAYLSYKGLLFGESSGEPGDTKRKKARKKTPPQLLKEVRERLAAQELAKDPNITAKILGKILDCDKSTVVRLKAWQKKNVLNSPLPKGFIKRTEDENYSTVEAINKPE